MELKKTSKANTHVLVVAQTTAAHIGLVIDCTHFSSLKRLLRVTTIVLSFIAMLQAKVQGNARPHNVETQTSRARLLWIQDVQAGLSDEPKFLIWKDDISLDLYLDDEGLWRCKGRMKNSDLSPSA